MIDYAAPHTVYLHRDADGRVIYAGCTVNLEQRTAQHRVSSRWWSDVASVEVDSVQPDYDSGRGRERALIRQHEPAHNIQGNPAREREKQAWQARAWRLPAVDPARAAAAAEAVATLTVSA